MVQFNVGRVRNWEYVVGLTALAYVGAMVAVATASDSWAVIDTIISIDLVMLAGLLALSLLNYACRALRWHIYSRHVGLRVPLAHSAAYYVSGFVMTTTPGKIGELLRLWLLQRRHGYSYYRSMPLVLGDRLADVNAMLLLMISTWFAFPDYIWGAIVAVVIVGLLTTAFTFPRPTMRLVGAAFLLAGRHRPRLFAKMRRTLRLTSRLLSWPLQWRALSITMIGWVAECLALYWLMIAFGIEGSVSHAVFIFTFAMMAGALSMLPGGLGSVEAVMIILLMSMDAEFEVALAITSIVRFTTLWFAVVLGAMTLPVVMRSITQWRANRAVELRASP